MRVTRQSQSPKIIPYMVWLMKFSDFLKTLRKWFSGKIFEKKFLRLNFFFIWDLEKFFEKIFDFFIFSIFDQNVEKMIFQQNFSKKIFLGFFHLGLRKIFEKFSIFCFSSISVGNTSKRIVPKDFWSKSKVIRQQRCFL